MCISLRRKELGPNPPWVTPTQPLTQAPKTQQPCVTPSSTSKYPGHWMQRTQGFIEIQVCVHMWVTDLVNRIFFFTVRREIQSHDFLIFNLRLASSQMTNSSVSENIWSVVIIISMIWSLAFTWGVFQGGKAGENLFITPVAYASGG